MLIRPKSLKNYTLGLSSIKSRLSIYLQKERVHLDLNRLKSSSENGYSDITIKSKIKMSLNGKPSKLLIDENADLTKVSSNWLKHSKGISNETKEETCSF